MTDDTSTLSSSVDENDTLNYLEEDDTDLENSNTTKKSPGAFRTISEVADEIHVPQHVLRFWESRFTQVQPVKRSGGRRYYRAEDIELLRYISELLYVHGYTIKGVQRLLKEDFSRFEEKKETEEEVVQTDTIASEEIIEQQDAEDINQDQSSSQQHDYVVDNYLQEIEKLKKENVFLVNSLEGILLELNELRKIVLNS